MILNTVSDSRTFQTLGKNHINILLFRMQSNIRQFHYHSIMKEERKIRLIFYLLHELSKSRIFQVNV